MRWGLDAAYPPTSTEMQRQRLLGYSFYCGYIGGKALNVWTRADWQRARAAGFDLLPIWVAPLVADAGWGRGVDDGNLCLATMQALRFSGVVCLDVENGLEPIQYALGFASACDAGQLSVVLYGSPKTIRAIGDAAWLAWWLAWWPGSDPVLSGAPPDWSMWQFATGSPADFNVCQDDFRFALLQSPEAPSAPPSAEA